MTPYKIVLADDHVMFREGIRRCLEELENVQVSGEVSDGLELMKLLKTSIPDLIILSIAMPKMRGLEVLRQVKKNYPRVKVVILTMHDRKGLVRQAVDAGADAYVLKEESSRELIKAIEAVRLGRTYFSPRLSDALVSFASEEEPEVLTKREKEVLRCVARGMTMQKISEALCISIHTVRRHRHNILQKLHLRSTAELVRYAVAKEYGE